MGQRKIMQTLQGTSAIEVLCFFLDVLTGIIVTQYENDLLSLSKQFGFNTIQLTM